MTPPDAWKPNDCAAGPSLDHDDRAAPPGGRRVAGRSRTAAASTRIDGRPELNAFITVMREAALADARAGGAGDRRRPLPGTSARHPGLGEGSRSTSPARRRRRDRRCRRGPRARMRRWSRGCARPARSSSARPTCTSSRSARPATRPRSGRCATRSTRRDRRADRAAAPRSRCSKACASDRSAPTPADPIRIPSAACGIVGLKPAFGELPCDGVVPLSATLDHVGPMARTVADAAVHVPGDEGAARAGIAPLSPGRAATFGVPAPVLLRSAGPGRAPGAGASARQRSRHAGHDDARPSPSSTPHARPTSTCTSCCRKPRGITRRLLDGHAERYSPGVRLRLEMGRYILAEDYVRAMRLRARVDGGRSIARSRAATPCCCRRCRSPRLPRGRDRRRRRARTSRCARRCCG